MASEQTRDRRRGSSGRVSFPRTRRRVRVHIADVRDWPRLPRLVRGQDFLFNLAGQTSHMDSMTDPQTDLDINCRNTLPIAERVAAVFEDSAATIGTDGPDPEWVTIENEEGAIAALRAILHRLVNEGRPGEWASDGERRLRTVLDTRAGPSVPVGNRSQALRRR